jgi:type IV secretion system protein TrbL
MSSSGAVLSPAILGTFQDVYIDKLVTALSNISGYSLSLFYLIAAIEIAVFGLVWAVRQEELFGAFIFKVIKLGMIFFLISEYPYLLQVIIDGFTQIAFQITPTGSEKLIFNPAMIWKYGFDHGIQMMTIAVQYGTTNMAMSNLFLCLGFGSILIFALIGVQIIVAVVGFYIVSLVALLLIPFGSFVGTQSFLSRALQGVLKAGVRVFVVILLIGIAASVWSALPTDAITMTTTFDKPLSLFLSALVVLILVWKLPEMAVQLVGEIKGDIWGSRGNQQIISSPSGSSGSAIYSVNSVASGSYVSPMSNDRSMSSATALSPSGSPGSGGSVATAASIQVNNTAGGAGLFSTGTGKSGVKPTDTLKSDEKSRRKI